mgnify:CR=1 FL=1
MSRARTLCLLAAACAATAGPSVAGAQFIGPTPYLSAADSPFAGLGFGWFHLEDFEDGALDTPGVALFGAGGSIVSPGTLTDAVDADGGPIDGSGATGRTLFSNFQRAEFTFDFDAVALGGLPTHAGIVWTDVANVTAGTFGFGDVTFEAFGPGLVPIGATGPFTLGDGDFAGQTAEDRFFGIVAAGGIQRIRIGMANSVDWEVDHLQYGRLATVPEPSTVALLTGGLAAAGAIGAARRRRR